MKCFAKDRNQKNCRNNQTTDNHFCKFHQYMKDYTTEMLEKCELCKGCRKMYYFGSDETNSIRTCDKCRTRDKSKYKKQVVLCKQENCKFQKSVDNLYCGKHQICVFIDETKESGKKLCVNYIRGCKIQLDMDYLFSKCEVCLEDARIKDGLRRKNAREKVNPEGMTTCSTCCKNLPTTEFIGVKENMITKTCLSCRKQNQIQDSKRCKEHRNELERQNITSKYSHYKKDASRRNLLFQLSEEQFTTIIFQNCNYCGIMEDIGFNGVDRIDSTQGYILGNVVGCCKMCNYMKGSLSVDTFIQRIHHIVFVNKPSEDLPTSIPFPESVESRESSHPQLFAFGDSKGGSYERYLKNAVFRNIPFLLSKEEFDNIILNPCYICKKENTTTHQNGIDRKENAQGYTMENSNSCCAECNFMKRNFDYTDIMDKIQRIYLHNIGFHSSIIHSKNKRFTIARKTDLSKFAGEATEGDS